MFGKVRRMYFRDQLSIKEIVRRTSLSRNTVKKWVQAPPGSEPSYRRAAVKSRLAPFEAQLHAALTADAQRPRRDRRSVLRLYQELRDAGFTGGYSTVTEYVRGVRSVGSVGSVWPAQVMCRSNLSRGKPSSLTGVKKAWW
jgi:transposase